MQNTSADAIRSYFVERTKGPTSIQLEKVTITELAMDKKYLHHNVYGIIRGTQLCCFTNILGKGVCYKDVGRFFIYEKPHEKRKISVREYTIKDPNDLLTFYIFQKEKSSSFQSLIVA